MPQHLFVDAADVRLRLCGGEIEAILRPYRVLGVQRVGQQRVLVVVIRFVFPKVRLGGLADGEQTIGLVRATVKVEGERASRLARAQILPVVIVVKYRFVGLKTQDSTLRNVVIQRQYIMLMSRVQAHCVPADGDFVA